MDYSWLDLDSFFCGGMHNLPKGPEPGKFQPTNDVYPFPFLHHAELVGYQGLGVDWVHAMSIWPTFCFAAVWLICRTIGRQYVFNHIARFMGVKGKKKQRKFGYQMWLALFYTSSTVWAYFNFIDNDYMGFPMDSSHGIHVTSNHNYPVRMTNKEKFFYLYELGFFIAELFAIFVEDRRSDFLEYLIHHVTTIILVALSYSSFNHKHGVYILFLHDASDIFLCVAKVFHYADFDPGVYVGFTLFTTIFAWLRLYNFPLMLHTLATTSHVTMPCVASYWFLWSLLFVLQLLHCYWFYLVVRMIFRLIAGTKGDVRSDEDESDEEPAIKKKKQ